MDLRPPLVASSSPTRHDEGADETDFMYILELIGRMIVNALKEAWLLPKTIPIALQQRRRRLAQQQLEAERLDRIRNPAKYAGR